MKNSFKIGLVFLAIVVTQITIVGPFVSLIRESRPLDNTFTTEYLTPAEMQKWFPKGVDPLGGYGQ